MNCQYPKNNLLVFGDACPPPSLCGSAFRVKRFYATASRVIDAGIKSTID